MGNNPPEGEREQIERTLVGIGQNPNISAALVVELGTESIDADEIADEIAAAERTVETLSIRDVGGTTAALEAGIDYMSDLWNEIATSAVSSAT